ncbi:MAG: hypothetical protein B7Z55_04630 [Planctomycetales bacterium 12-60-4]|nr:MAG: hypothetical protein B7Z55_04630 [Planctomycetales bacterium 12-60-4]
MLRLFLCCLVSLLAASGAELSAEVVRLRFPSFRRPDFDFALQEFGSTVTPLVLPRYDRILTAWGCYQGGNPTLALIDPETGSCLWKYSESSRATAYVYALDAHVLITSLDKQNRTTIHSWLDVETGQTIRQLVLENDRFVTGFMPLETVAVFRGKELYDLATGEHLGSLPVEISDTGPVEIDGRLLAFMRSGKECELVLIDVATRELVASLKLADVLPQELNPRFFCSLATFSRKGQAILWYPEGSTEEFNARLHLAAVDVIHGQFLWKQTTPLSAPIALVDDLDLDPTSDELGTAERPFLIEWTTGRFRIPERPENWSDVVHWTLPTGAISLDERARAERRILIVDAAGKAHVMSLDKTGVLEWSRSSDMRTNPFQSRFRCPFVWTSDSRWIVESVGFGLDIIHPDTGKTERPLTADSLGISLSPWKRDAESASPPTVPAHPADQSEKLLTWYEQIPPWIQTAVGIGSCLLVYIAVRWLFTVRSRESKSASPRSATGSSPPD